MKQKKTFIVLVLFFIFSGVLWNYKHFLKKHLPFKNAAVSNPQIGEDLILKERGFLSAPSGINFDLGSIVLSTNENDISGGFLKSALGKMIMFRCGISENDISDFLKNRKTKLISTDFSLGEGPLDLSIYFH